MAVLVCRPTRSSGFSIPSIQMSVFVSSNKLIHAHFLEETFTPICYNHALGPYVFIIGKHEKHLATRKQRYKTPRVKGSAQTVQLKPVKVFYSPVPNPSTDHPSVDCFQKLSTLGLLGLGTRLGILCPVALYFIPCERQWRSWSGVHWNTATFPS